MWCCDKMWKKKYAAALPLATLDRKQPGNYVIQSFGNENDRKVISLPKEGNRLLLVNDWQNDFSPDKMFRIEPCSDDLSDFVVTLYGDAERQWFVDGTVLKASRYPNASGAERLRPPLKNWRFHFEAKGTPGMKNYRIITRDEDLEDSGRVCLRIGSPNEKGVCQLEFGMKDDNDPNQVWCLHTK